MTQAVPLWHAMRALGAGTLLITGRCQKDEAPFDMASSGIPILTPDSIKANSEGLLLLPELSNHLPWLGDQRIKRQLTELLAVSQPDVVHTHTSKAGWLGRQAAFSARVPVVAHTFHGHVLRDYFGPIRSHLLANLERRLARRTNLLFTISDSCATELSELGIADHKRFHVVPPAVRSWPSVDRAVARQQLGVVDDQFLVACIGRLVPIKRVDHFAEAVQIAPWLFGHVFGDGPDAPRLQRHYRDLRRLTFHGVNHSVRSLLPAFDALVLTSIREGLPWLRSKRLKPKCRWLDTTFLVFAMCSLLAVAFWCQSSRAPKDWSQPYNACVRIRSCIRSASPTDSLVERDVCPKTWRRYCSLLIKRRAVSIRYCR